MHKVKTHFDVAVASKTLAKYVKAALFHILSKKAQSVASARSTDDTEMSVFFPDYKRTA